MRNTWDYIIAGAGTAGCILAARLTADPDVSVLLVEAGGRRWNPWLHVPVGYFKTVGNSKTDCENPLRNVIVDEFAPGAHVESDGEILEFVRQNASTIFHPVGSCRMGSDPDSVVDTKLRVRGIDGLRVVDASIMPTITSGNTNAPVIAIAEKASDLILGLEYP